MNSSIPVTSQVIESFSGVLPSGSDLIHLPSLERFIQPGSGMSIHRPTGLLTSSFVLSEEEVANYWTSRIFAVQNDQNYTATRPFAVSRLNYVALTALAFFNSIGARVSSICDFATGESVLPDILSRLSSFDISVTETSRELRDLALTKGYTTYDLTFGLPDNSGFHVDAAFLTWTLCNCRNPLGAVQTVSSHVRPGGFVVLADSSRIMVPFKKSLADLLTSEHPLDIHPYFFSINSLRSVGELAGLQYLYSNRYRDSDVMMAIFRRPEVLSRPARITCDSPDIVQDFMEKYLDYSIYFEKFS